MSRESVSLPVAKEPRTRSVFGLVTGLSALSMSVLALAAAAMFFSGFVESDPVGIQLVQAFALSFGVAALLAVPFGVMAWWALKGRAPHIFVALIMMVPWMIIGALWVIFAPYDWFIGVVPALVAVLCLLWTFRERAYPRDQVESHTI